MSEGIHRWYSRIKRQFRTKNHKIYAHPTEPPPLMVAAPRQLQVKIGKRNWQFLVIHSTEPPKIFLSLLNDDPDQSDLLIVTELNESLKQLWEESIASQPLSGWKTQVITNGVSLDPSLSGLCLVVGPQRLLEHLLATPRQGTSPRPEIESSTQRIDLAEIPPFPEERRSADPFGQNKQLQNDALNALAQFIGVLAKKAHLQGIAMTLPSSSPEEVYPLLEPWSRIAPLNLSPDLVSLATLQKQLDADVGPEDDVFTELTLLQRCLATLSFLPTNSMSNDDWLQAAQAFEDLGYLFINHQHIETYSGLVEYFHIGILAAFIHSLNCVHGDLSLSNILYAEEQPFGERANTFDLVRQSSLDHPITALERAKDLALLKLECPFLLWEAIKAGYRFKAPKEAEEVFQFI